MYNQRYIPLQLLFSLKNNLKNDNRLLSYDCVLETCPLLAQLKVLEDWCPPIKGILKWKKCWKSLLFFAEICSPPDVAFGYVTGEAADSGRVFFGTVNCLPGYELVGKSLIKCMNGIWSSEYPVCTRKLNTGLAGFNLYYSFKLVWWHLAHLLVLN